MALAQPQGAQHWEATGMPLNMTTPYVCYADTVNDAIYVGGDAFFVQNGIAYFPLFRYQNYTWDTLGRFGNSIRAAIVYHDTLIVGGGFPTVGDSAIEKIACYAAGTWHPYGSIHGAVSRLRIIDGELYALGIFDTADGSFCNGIAKRVGGHWEPVGVLPVFNGDGSAWFKDAISFQGRLVVTGNFTSADGTIHDVMAYDGTSWQPVCNCLTGGMDGGAALMVYQGDLYLGGRFYFGPGTPGQGLMRWDGNQWYRVGQPGGGLQLYDHSDYYPPTINVLTVRDGLLLAAGAFFFADHTPADGVASWDGSKWCSLGGTLNGANAMTFFHDTLYIGCNQYADGELVNGVARFIGSSYQENCATTGIAEAVPVTGMQVLPAGPEAIVLTHLTDGPHALKVYDAEGRLVLDRHVHSSAGRSDEVQLDPGNALYILRVDGVRTAKFIPVR